jgi:NAD(P)-dependent dehydrogenase (short-subunit alcohol dehydrogenase family)
MLSKAAAVEYVRDNIRVNSIHPGLIDTSMMATLPADSKKRGLESTPMGRHHPTRWRDRAMSEKCRKPPFAEPS